MKLYSSEIRWFSDTKENLFNIYDRIPGESFFIEERTDHYFITESVDLGIKLRGGADKLEVKWLLGLRRAFSVNGFIIGRIENWIKSGFESKNNIPAYSIKNNEWLKIYKKRYKKRFEIADDEIKAVKGNFVGYSDCDMEFTEVVINDDKKYFTIGFESLGEIGISRLNLEKTLVYCSEYFNAETLINCLSVSYPYIIKEYTNPKG